MTSTHTIFDTLFIDRYPKLIYDCDHNVYIQCAVLFHILVYTLKKIANV
jgi:hypothetical protein